MTFAAKEIEIKTATAEPYTAYWLTASEPEHVRWSPGLSQYSITLVRLDVPHGTTLKSDDKLKQIWPVDAEVVETIALSRLDVVALATRQPINILLTGSKPIVAYVPVEESTVSLSQPESTFPTEPARAIIREAYAGVKALPDGSPALYATLGYPIVDAISPSVIITTDDPSAALIAPGYHKLLNSGERPGWTHEALLIVSVPFSTRIAAMALAQASLDDSLRGMYYEPGRNRPTNEIEIAWPSTAEAERDSAREKDFKLGSYQPNPFKKPDASPRPLGPGEEVITIEGSPWSQPTLVTPRIAGTTEVSVLTALTASEYSIVAEELRRHDKVTVSNIRSRAVETDGMGLGFRYPALPPVDGFNIFGLLDRLNLSVRSGEIMIGATSVTIGAPSSVELRNILALTTSGNVVPVPLVIGGGMRQTLEFHLEATSELYLNGRQVTVSEDTHRTVVQYSVALANIVSALCAVLALWHTALFNARNKRHNKALHQ